MKLIVENGLYYILESPDQIYVHDGKGKSKNLFGWDDGGDAFPFGYYKNKMVIGQEGHTHSVTISNGRTTMKFPGRIWTRKKVISFWSYPSISKLKQIIKDIEHTFNNVPLDRYGSDDFPPNPFPDKYGDTRPINSRGEDYGKIKIDGSWRLDIPAISGDRYTEFVKGTGGADVSPKNFYSNGYLYSLKTVFSDKPLKGAGEKLRKGKEVSTDKGQQHVAPAMLKKSKISKMSKKQKTDLYNYFKDKGRLNPAEKRMYAMIAKENIEIFFDGVRFMFGESIEDRLQKRLNKFDKKQIDLGIKAEKEHDPNDKDPDLDVVKGNLDLIKIVIAHLEEDPQYYTKLEKMEESNKKHFTLDEETGILTEAPHITVGEKVIDLEFEKDKNFGLKKIIKAIMREELTDKYGNKFKLSSDREVNEFIRKIMKNPQIKRMLA